jgi:putative transposase
MRWLTITHTQRWRTHSHTVGEGHLYQGRYKCFPVQTDRHFLLLCRYVERNALAAKLVEHAQDWRWTSLWQRRNPGADLHKLHAPWPVDRPSDWLAAVNRPLRAADQTDIQQCIRRNRPFGEPAWQHRTAAKLGLEHTFRQRGRPKMAKKR